MSCLKNYDLGGDAILIVSGFPLRVETEFESAEILSCDTKA